MICNTITLHSSQGFSYPRLPLQRLVLNLSLKVPIQGESADETILVLRSNIARVIGLEDRKGISLDELSKLVDINGRNGWAEIVSRTAEFPWILLILALVFALSWLLAGWRAALLSIFSLGGMLQLPFSICLKVCRYFWLSGGSGCMEGFRRATHNPVDRVQWPSNSRLGCTGRPGSALAQRCYNLLLFRSAVGGFPNSVWPHGLGNLGLC
jgi:hypothetical protein